MPYPRASSGLLRSRVRVRPAVTPAPVPHRTQIRNHNTGNLGGDKHDLGGPGGQQPPPQKPGGPEAVKRNWVPLGGAALLATAVFAYFGRAGDAQTIKKDAKDAARKVEDKAEKVVGRK